MIRRRMLRRTALLAPLLALTVGGCAAAGGTGVNTGDFKGDQKAVAQTLSDLSDAARSKDGGRACSQILSHAIVDALGSDCAQVMKDQFGDADSFKLDVKSIDVSGNRATAQVTSDVNGTSRPATISLVRQGSGWRVDKLGG
jgi:hypothetical protein